MTKVIKKNAAYYRRLLKKETDPMKQQKLQTHIRLCEARKLLGFGEL